MLAVAVVVKADLEDHSNELKMAEDNAKKAMADATKLSEELRHEQEHSLSIEKLRRTLESQVKELQVRATVYTLRTRPAYQLSSLPASTHYPCSRAVFT